MFKNSHKESSHAPKRSRLDEGAHMLANGSLMTTKQRVGKLNSSNNVFGHRSTLKHTSKILFNNITVHGDQLIQ